MIQRKSHKFKTNLTTLKGNMETNWNESSCHTPQVDSTSELGTVKDSGLQYKNAASKSCSNVGASERTGSGLIGATVVMQALRSGGVKGLLMAGLGASLIYRAATGHCKMYEKLGISTADSRLKKIGIQ